MADLETGVGNMRVFEGQQLSTEGALAVVDGLVNLQEENETDSNQIT